MKMMKEIKEFMDKLVGKDVLLTDNILEKEGFEKQINADDGEEYHYWTLDINDICLITNASDECKSFTVFIFDNNLPVAKNLSDLVLIKYSLNKYV